MINVRTHVLDGTPCGPASFAESLAVCRAAAAEGFRTIVATPRWEAGSAEPPLPFDECRLKLNRLQAETRGSLSLHLGFALQFSPSLPSLVERHGSKLALAGGRHLLVSLPSVGVPAQADGVWQLLLKAGFSVILSHPEHNPVLRRDAARLAGWVSDGLTLQLGVASLTGAYGREVQRFAVECASRYQAATVAASSLRQPAATGARPSSPYQLLAGRLGARRARAVLIRNPAALLSRTVGRDTRPDARGQAAGSFATLLRFMGYKAT